MEMNISSYITLDIVEEWKSSFRWKLGIGTNPCIQSRKGTCCSYCGFLGIKYPLQPDEVGDFITNILAKRAISRISRLELYMSGSFFDNQEVSKVSRIKIGQALRNAGMDGGKSNHCYDHEIRVVYLFFLAGSCRIGL